MLAYSLMSDIRRRFEGMGEPQEGVGVGFSIHQRMLAYIRCMAPKLATPGHLRIVAKIQGGSRTNSIVSRFWSGHIFQYMISSTRCTHEGFIIHYRLVNERQLLY